MPISAPGAPRKNRKLDLLQAAQDVLKERGLAGVTTRAVAERVGCSEAAIYVHFENRLELVLAVFERALPEMLGPLDALDALAGCNTPHANLVSTMRGLSRFHDGVAAILGSLFAEPALLQQVRERLMARGKGPQNGIGRLSRYIAEEQKLGRLAAEVDAEAVATTLMSVSFFQAFSGALLGTTAPGSSARRIVTAVLGPGRG